MKVAFRPLPNGSLPRPVLDVRFPGAPREASLPVLVDSGAAAVRLPTSFGLALGFDVSAGRVLEIGLGGQVGTARVQQVELALHRWTWSAEVAFTDLLTFHGIVGLDGFFDRFRVNIDGSRNLFYVRPAKHLGSG